MPGFTQLQNDTKLLFDRLMLHFMNRQIGCNSFFSVLVPSHSYIHDACVISKFAGSMENKNDDILRRYSQNINQLDFLTDEQLVNFKYRALVGIYLLKWATYQDPVISYINKPIIELFKNNLEIQLPSEMDEDTINSSLDALSQYCSYLYDNTCKNSYAELCNDLGLTIQLEIHNLRYLRGSEHSSWHGMYVGLMRTLGIG